ncbi:hypothetical protein BD779DRAFT_1207221 [Infundibulicybe gibba]|nr:hypothetical protein BD779DRAFT_1207221 [Infundibulicybe gibba]
MLQNRSPAQTPRAGPSSARPKRSRRQQHLPPDLPPTLGPVCSNTNDHSILNGDPTDGVPTGTPQAGPSSAPLKRSRRQQRLPPNPCGMSDTPPATGPISSNIDDDSIPGGDLTDCVAEVFALDPKLLGPQGAQPHATDCYGLENMQAAAPFISDTANMTTDLPAPGDDDSYPFSAFLDRTPHI